ncbi:TadE/TadG family type IV pilus assembly protein [Sandarakinorhabdus rubra]|uniref:TadE/TadG family type IV pilus assembly protein n=1 Tax=Sandarakinorhabdus rubra TaxID=2672568 RepID=UPI0013DD5AB2|nr:TadE/TadG family type IV pilus assembly protein [Sandarakinorhabdus rubra]
MMRRLARMAQAPARRLAGDRRGATAAEFALTVPIWAMLIFGLFNLSRVYFGRAGVLNGLGEAARVATLWPRRPDSDMRAAFTARTFGLISGETPSFTVTPGTANGQDFVDIQVSYTPRISLLLISVPTVTLTYQRRAFRPEI